MAHVISQPFTMFGCEYVRCSCSLALETYGLPHLRAVCPIAEIEADYAQAIEALTKRRDESIARWKVPVTA